MDPCWLTSSKPGSARRVAILLFIRLLFMGSIRTLCASRCGDSGFKSKSVFIMAAIFLAYIGGLQVLLLSASLSAAALRLNECPSKSFAYQVFEAILTSFSRDWDQTEINRIYFQLFLMHKLIFSSGYVFLISIV
jgi:hypothetical protein